MRILENYINRTFATPSFSEVLDVLNPATEEVLAQAPLSDRADLDRALTTAKTAFLEWLKTQTIERVKYIFAFKNLIEAHFDEITTKQSFFGDLKTHDKHVIKFYTERKIVIRQ